METRAEIIKLGDSLIRDRGYNAFSFSDISKRLNIKNASVHYHFPSKTALGIAVIQENKHRLEQLKSRMSDKTPVEKFKAFLNIYSEVKSENKVCIVGSLATDLQTVEPEIQEELKKLANAILEWVSEILRDGKSQGFFHFNTNERTKALLVISNMLAAVQLTRLTDERDFREIKYAVLNDLIQ